uniref:p74 n=1 Tax=Cryptophlebia leucotreta granulosis virus TaxID=35254 RepID=A0A2H4ZK72_GVCL|nr:p74 [Cryptophlebia leucotreta granulovirus]
MATPTSLDIINAVNYLTNRDTLEYIIKWRQRFPHILVDYNVRYASNNDYYVPPKLRLTSAVVVQLFFSKEGCKSMSCYPYTETGVIDFENTPLGGYTQTSNTSVQYNQPACFNLDPSLAARDGNIQSVELRYTNHNQCILVDTFTKVWMNTPYIRTSKHVVRGVDDVPGFDISNDDDPVFPERIKGKFNEAYCRRFGRSENNNACTQPWYEIFVSFVLGESILSTFKLASTNVFDDLRNFDYHKPSHILPDAPEPEGISMLEDWYSVRDKNVDSTIELGFLHNIFPIKSLNEVLMYTANSGFQIDGSGRNGFKKRGLIEEFMEYRTKKLKNGDNRDKSLHKEKSVFSNTPKYGLSNNNELESIIVEFLEDHTFIMSILTDLGFNVLESTISNMLNQINKVLIPALRRMLLMQSGRITAALMGQTYKAAIIHSLNRAFITTVTTVAKASVKAVKAAASIANLALTFLTIADLVLMIWDPFGYNNMFPRNYLDDLSTAFLSAYYESVDATDRNLIEFQPQHFANFVIDDEEEYFVGNMLHLADYMAALDVNSNGQLVNLLEGDVINDFDEEELVGVSLAANDTWSYFKWFCARHDALVKNISPTVKMIAGFGILTSIIGLLYYLKNFNQIPMNYKQCIELLFLILIILCLILLILPSLQYYTKIINHKTI